jgi:hypothetical protein
VDKRLRREMAWAKVTVPEHNEASPRIYAYGWVEAEFQAFERLLNKKLQDHILSHSSSFIGQMTEGLAFESW